MTYYANRTCTPISNDPNAPAEEVGPRPLESFANHAAYVLLGPPGAGKSVAFELEAARTEGVYVTARNFLTFNRREWEGKTLFIDGLDEKRAGTTDGRTAIDAIRSKLHNMRRSLPGFRLSCREADWFGSNDRDHLQTVSPDGRIEVLRLDPLSDEAICEILSSNHSKDGNEFLAAARDRGIDALLAYPQSLMMLATAVRGDAWPRSRRETFELACRTLLEEHNEDHRIATDDLDINVLFDASGRLCLLQLLTGASGFRLHGASTSHDTLSITELSPPAPSLLRAALQSKLFQARPDGAIEPMHRVLAEFLAARHLAALLRAGLSSSRALSLFVGFDGGFVSELRGLAAWLAALSPHCRLDIVDRDPLGTVLYGDISAFSPADKQHLLARLKRVITGNPWIIRTINIDSRFADMVTDDLYRHIHEALIGHDRSTPRQAFVSVLLEILKHDRTPADLQQPFIDALRDPSWWPRIRHDAVALLAHPHSDRLQHLNPLRSLLADVASGTVTDPDDDLLGALLMALYPHSLSASEAAQYLQPRKNSSVFGLYFTFWISRFPRQSSPSQLIEFIDSLWRSKRPEWHSPRYTYTPGRFVMSVPTQALMHLLRAAPETISPAQLFHWLLCVSEYELDNPLGNTQFFRDWLSEHPDTIKDIILRGIDHCLAADNFNACMVGVNRRLFGVSWPSDFGAWCLSQAIATDSSDVQQYFIHHVAESVGSDGQGGVTVAFVEDNLRNRADLMNMFRAALDQSEEYETPETHGDVVEIVSQNSAVAQVREYVSDNRESLGSTGTHLRHLYDLAMAYFGAFSDVKGQTGRDRLQYLLGNDGDLCEAVLAGFVRTTRRTDLPDDVDVARLASDGRVSLLGAPFLAGLQELSDADDAGGFSPSEEQARLAIGIRFAMSAWPWMSNDQRPEWLANLIHADPLRAAKVLVRVGRIMLRSERGQDSLTHELAHSPGLSPVVQLAAPRLLDQFPVRCRPLQLPSLRNLLRTAFTHGERRRFLRLVDQKLEYNSMDVGQRVHWLGAGLLLAPDRYADQLIAYVGKNRTRARHLAKLWEALDVGDTFGDRDAEVTALVTVIRLFGATHQPPSGKRSPLDNWMTPSRVVTEAVEQCVHRIARIPTSAATEALESLVRDESLKLWRPRLLDSTHRQKELRREADFCYPRIDDILAALDNAQPLNTANLKALVLDKLECLSHRIRDGHTSDYRQYWNRDSHNRAVTPLPENACRAVLQSDLELILEGSGIVFSGDGQYADDTKTDISVSFGDFKVPIEAKKSFSPDLWTALREQLIAKYTRDPGADGYGIYLVFWFGNEAQWLPTREPSAESRPTSRTELQDMLEAQLSDTEARKISVCVIDVARPSSA